MPEFPEHCLRALQHKDHFTEDGLVNFMAFMPDPRTAQLRQDNQSETSINWEDDDGALPFTRAVPNTKGVARLKRTTMDDINRKPGSLNTITYVRSDLPDNKYHGDILIQAGLSKGRIRMITSSLALDASLA